MTDSSSEDRLDRIETDLEAVKEILLSTARLAEGTDKRLDRLTQNQQESQKQLDRLRENIDIAFETIKLLSENTDRSIAQSRQEMSEFRAEIRQVWDYLMRRSQNGDSTS